MNVFGQVWLWSLLAFVAGVLLTWLVMVRPARKQVADLEDQLLDARRSAAPIAAPAPVDDFEVDEWEDTPPRSLSDEVLAPPAPAPYVEPPAYFGEPVQAPAPVAEEPPAQAEEEPVEQEPVTAVRQYMEADEAQRRFEEQLAEQKARTDTEDDRPRSLFERLSPESAPEETPAEMTTVLPRSGLEAADFDDEPELPAEQPSFVPTAQPTAEVAPPAQEPTAPPEVDEHVDDFIYQPREVWAEQEQEAFLDEAAEQEDDEPAGTRSEQTTFIAVEESSWPANDLTGEYQGLRDEISGQLDGFVEPEAPAEQTMVEPLDLDAPHVRNGVFETTLAEEQGFTEPKPEQPPAHARREPLEPEDAEPESFDAEPQPSHTEAESSPHGEPQPSHTEPPLSRTEVESSPHGEPQPSFRAEPQSHPEPQRSFRAEPQPQSHPEPQPSFHTEPERKSQPEPVGFVQPFSTPGAPPPAPFSAFGAPAETPTETTGRQPRAVAAAFDHAVETPRVPAAPEPVADRPRSLFEPLLDADEPLPPLGQTRQLPEPTDDQPFVPKFVPSDEPLLAAPPEPEPEPVQTDLPQRVTEAGLPIREARRTTQQRQQSFAAFAAFESPKQEAPPAPPALPTRPRPVGFSPSTGGRPNGAAAPGSSRFQQPEGFNPRSPFGPGSVLPKSDGLAPAADFAVKATLTGRRYYTEGSANFSETRADVWFRTEADAEKAGFRPAP
ncbi:sunset domain-containing protein [Lentzea flava]|uniref:Uncharacterized protein n=1 Tax=Lentzea flava TaxID=103732 RepID=A0ABQ2UHY1_9PSEU|nr:hypothetical protein [Lentzea flava]MCP2198815.1 hypothetical protein [Lentzea flava]GGU30299.1 hypothetical protein GCM10010178_23250 [Lentzea flava]